MDSKQTSLVLPKVIINHAKNNPDIKSLTDWVIERYCKEFLTDVYVQHKSEELKSIINLTKVAKDIVKPKELFTIGEISWIKLELLDKWENKRFDKKSQYNRFQEHFSKKMQFRQFRIYVDKLYREMYE